MPREPLKVTDNVPNFMVLTTNRSLVEGDSPMVFEGINLNKVDRVYIYGEQEDINIVFKKCSDGRIEIDPKDIPTTVSIFFLIFTEGSAWTPIGPLVRQLPRA